MNYSYKQINMTFYYFSFASQMFFARHTQLPIVPFMILSSPLVIHSIRCCLHNSVLATGKPYCLQYVLLPMSTVCPTTYVVLRYVYVCL